MKTFVAWLVFLILSICWLFYACISYISTAYVHNRQQFIGELQDIQEQYRREKRHMEHRLLRLENMLSHAQEFTVTAYTHAAPGGDINGEGHGITRSGVPVREGIVAVDPAVIPLGSHVWVEGFGVLLAADTGGAIRGKRLDVFMNCREQAINFGRQELRVVKVGE